jgi:hypothetical protein
VSAPTLRRNAGTPASAIRPAVNASNDATISVERGPQQIGRRARVAVDHGDGPEQQFGVGDDEQRAPRQTRAEVLGHVGAPIQLECAVAHDDAALVRQARQELDREKGVAARAGEQRGQGVAGGRSEPVGDEGSQVVGRQRRWDEGHPFSRRYILQASQCGGVRVRAGRREQQDPQGSRPDGERPQPVQALVVGPVDIVGDHRQWPGRRQALGRRHDGTDRIGVGVAVELREQGSDQRQAPAAVGLVDGAAAPGHTEPVELVDAGGQQARLADPGLAGDVDDAPRAGRHRFDGNGKGGQLTGPPEEDGRHGRRE